MYFRSSYHALYVQRFCASNCLIDLLFTLQIYISDNDVDGERADCGLTESMIAYLFDKPFKKQLKFRLPLPLQGSHPNFTSSQPRTNISVAPVSPANQRYYVLNMSV